MSRCGMLTAIDFLCGAGGWACAARGLPIRFVAVADLEADCLETWRVNHLRHHSRCKLLQVDLGSMAGVNQILAALADRRVDLVVGSIPCEQVSTARQCGDGKNRCSAAELSQLHLLIDNVLGLVKSLRPRWWAIEDVIQAEKHMTPAIDLGFEVPMRRSKRPTSARNRGCGRFSGYFPIRSRRNSRAHCDRASGRARIGPSTWRKASARSSAAKAAGSATTRYASANPADRVGRSKACWREEAAPDAASWSRRCTAASA